MYLYYTGARGDPWPFGLTICGAQGSKGIGNQAPGAGGCEEGREEDRGSLYVGEAPGASLRGQDLGGHPLDVPKECVGGAVGLVHRGDNGS